MKQRHAVKYPISRYLNTHSAYFPSIAPDGQRMAFISDITGVPQAWLMRLAADVDEVLWPDQLTFGVDRVTGLWFSPAPQDPRLIFSRDAGGNEKEQLSLLHTGDGTEILLTEGHEGAVHRFGGWSSDGTRILFAANRRDGGLFDLYLQALDGSARLVWENHEPGYLSNISFSPDGSHALMTRMSASFRHDLIEVDLGSGAARLLSPSQEDARYEAACYEPDGRSLLLNTDLASDFLHILRLRLDDMSTESVVSLDWDAELMTLSPDGRYVAYEVNMEGASKLTLFDLTTGETRVAPGTGNAPGVVAMTDERLAFAPDSRSLAFSFTSATRSSDVYVWDLEDDRVRAVTRSSHGGIPAGAFVAPELVRFPTFDEVAPGQVREIPAWFYRPAERRGAKMPVVVYVHGGPASQFRPDFVPLLQFLLQRGYAVFAPNVRGSTGYGKAYAALDDVERRMDSVADLDYATRWLKGQPDVDGDRLAIYGRSYGGFMVLSAVATYPDLWAAAVDVVGISDWVTFLENTSGYRRAHREVEYGSLATDREFLRRISPIHQVDRMVAPMMVIHGANDPRVPVSETEQMAAALAQRGVLVELLVFDDEGHKLAKLKNKLVADAAVADFLDKHLA